MKSLLTLSNLAIGYLPGTVLIKDLNLSISAGQIIGLVGQNGVGKSTLIRTICRLQPALTGKILLSGKDLNTLSPKDIAQKVSVVLTDKVDSLNLTVLELVALGRHPYSGWLGTLREQDKLSIESALSLMEINYLAEKKLYELSDGQLQKVMIARALAQETDLIILDEPTSHLDLKNKIEVLHLLQKIAKSGKAVLLSTHEIPLASQVCDQFWCMDFGKDMLTGNPGKLIDNGSLQAYLHLPAGVSLQ